ncbi:hypothetical protein HPP92_014161 [Vanilla planifolia]|uniref:Fe2OG dioxygenase domain-containing protein n=2 Tax=Vanilla planifolia TaxID=51239 RepID=A0A835UVY8_VANPL|nr:hypothetical protein HPP92_014161 [Vanilla planifolia]
MGRLFHLSPSYSLLYIHTEREKEREREMEEGIGRYGSSLKVDNVQALAGRVGSDIPERYIRQERQNEYAHSNSSSDGCAGVRSIPIIDYNKLTDPNFSDEEAAKLHSACQEWGFFQVVNHGVPGDILYKMKQDTEGFFKLPLEEKESVAQLPGHLEGYGQAFVLSEKQKLDWGDMLFIGTLPSHIRQTRFWPTNPHTFSETIDKYSIEVKRVSDILFRKISENLGLGQGKLYEMFDDGVLALRFNYYPPCPRPEEVLGISPHSDGNGLTLLLQVSDFPGLQIRRKGRWFTVEVIPGAFVCNVGDIVEILSNGRYKSVEHRAVVSERNERISVAAFRTLNVGDTVGPISELVQGEEVLYKTLPFEEYLKILLSSKLEGKSNIDHMKLDA